MERPRPDEIENAEGDADHEWPQYNFRNGTSVGEQAVREAVRLPMEAQSEMADICPSNITFRVSYLPWYPRVTR